jgi:hypothetical protein
LVILLLELAIVLGELLVGLKSAYRFRQTAHIDCGSNAYEEDWTISLEGTPGFEDFRFRDRGGNRPDFQRTGLCVSPASFFFHVMKCGFEIDARFFHRLTLGSLEDFLFRLG